MTNSANNVAPQLLVAWERPGRAFLAAIGPALSRSPRRLVYEVDDTGVPARAVLASTLFQAALVIVVAALMPLVLPATRWSTALPPDTRVYTLAYLPSLSPQAEDSTGAEEGRSGERGGATAYHPAQVIRIARGAAQVPMVYQPPKLALPAATAGFMNLVVVPATPIVPLPDASSITLHSRPGIPAAMDVVPPMAPADNVASINAKLILPAIEPVPPPPTIPAISTARVPQIPTNIVKPPSTDDKPGAPPAVAGLSRAPEAGFLISATPGYVAGAPAEPRPGTLSMSPHGHGTTGAGGSGGGTGTANGGGSGSGRAGDGSGSALAGSGYGSDKLARGGAVGGPGPGGTVNASTSGSVGVSIHAGPLAQPGVIYLSSFGASTPSQMNSNVQVPLGPRRKPDVTIVATSRAGGGLAAYGILTGPRVYTTYLDTTAGAVVLQYADNAATEPGYDGDLIAPDPLNLSLPPSLPIAQVIVACTIDRTGVLREFRVLEANDTNFVSRILAALANWRFRPVLRRDTPIEVSAILGFHVGTR